MTTATTETPTEQVPIEEGLFTWPADEPQLIGSRCRSCGQVYFPSQRSCARCTAQDMEEHLLPRRGQLWTWTIQGFPPKSPPYAGPEVTPKDFTPYGVGYVELPGELRVESRLTTADPGELEIGMPMELVVVPFKTDEQGREVMMFAFRPAKDEGE